MEKYYEKEGMASVGEASAKEVRGGKYDAEFKEPGETFETFMEELEEDKGFGGSVGRPRGEER